ncbi:hypothetical protein ACIQ6V_25985 [Streptomyces sp. NPDC096198]|uniref:phosphotransferase-like protein n=1 Tax=Streptomyces sp. NPDC096198 TaxID=3366080 RepID=UPI0038133DDE
MTEVIVLNGGSSSGKSRVVRCLQAVLPDPWLALGTDTLVEAMPSSMRASDAGIEFAPHGQVFVGPEFRTIGMAAPQAELIHRGMVYDLEVDSAHAESVECARTVAAQVSRSTVRLSGYGEVEY